VVDGQRGNWRQLISPPKETATIAYGSNAEVEGLAVNHSTLTVWRLAPTFNKWVKVQVLNILKVPTQSSSAG
jgi:hypothetical protein